MRSSGDSRIAATSDFFAHHQHPLVQPVCLRIFGKEISPKTSLQKSLNPFSILPCLDFVNQISICLSCLSRQCPFTHLYIRCCGEIDPSKRFVIIYIFRKGYRLNKFLIFYYCFKKFFKPLLFVDPLMRARPCAKFFAVISKDCRRVRTKCLNPSDIF